MYRQIERLHENREFLQKTWLFGESISPPIQGRIAERMELVNYYRSGVAVEQIDGSALYLVQSGTIQRFVDGETRELLQAGEFFGEESAFFGATRGYQMVVAEPASIYQVPADLLREIPVVLWKLLETYQRRKGVYE